MALLSHAYALYGLVNANEIAELAEILMDVSRGVARSVLPLATGAGAYSPNAIVIDTVNGNIQIASEIDNRYTQRIESSGSIGAVIGGQAAVSQGSFQGSVTQDIRLENVDLDQLANELQRLLEELGRDANTQERRTEIEQVRDAAVAARQGDRKSVGQHLARVGRWVLDTATQIGAGVVVAVITKSTGI